MGNACLPMVRVLRRHDGDPCSPPARNSVMASSNNITSDGMHEEGRSTSEHPWLIFGLLSARTRQMSEEQMVLEALRVIRTLVDNDQEPPEILYRIHEMAASENGWMTIMQAMVNCIPLDDSLGPAVAELIVDNCPLPSKHDIQNFFNQLKLSRPAALAGRQQPTRHRNICLLIGCFAAKLPGQMSSSILTEAVLDYLLCNLNAHDTHPLVTLFALIALEKLAQTGENKQRILNRFAEFEGELSQHPLVQLERLNTNDHYVKKQIQFSAQWSLDNVFISPERPFTFEMVDMSAVNAMLSQSDASEYLKISADGLNARNDCNSFESVRCTHQVDSGVWYYEATVITTGVMQIGWATKQSKFLNHEGFGVGDDEYSIAYDGCRQLVWHAAQCDHHFHPSWNSGDVLGCLLDLNRCKVIFSLNGSVLRPYSHIFKRVRSGFFAAASFMTYQQCEFNFGQQPFRYPPYEYDFKTFQTMGTLEAEQRMILPRPKRLELRKLTIAHDSCSLCCDEKANVQLEPCHHQGFCRKCADMLECCPLCRRAIHSRMPLRLPQPLLEANHNNVASSRTSQ